MSDLTFVMIYMIYIPIMLYFLSSIKNVLFAQFNLRDFRDWLEKNIFREDLQYSTQVIQTTFNLVFVFVCQ